LIHPSHIFLATPLLSLFFLFSITLFHSLIHIYFSLLLYFSFFLFHTHIFSLNLSLSRHIYLSSQSSQLLSFLHAHNLKTMLETRRNFESRLCSRNAMYKRDVLVRVWNSAMYRTSDVKVTLPNAWRA
jgi:hypothetical protein